jgi:ZIP family zinc transporter/zinc and cadmium transporter
VTPGLVPGIVSAGAALLGAHAVVKHVQRELAAIELFVAFSAGFMIALALVAAIPESIARGGASAALVILLGYMLVHLAQHTFTPHFHFGEETHTVSSHASGAAISGLVVHTFFDGVAIASGYLVSPTLGLLFFAAIALHKLPEGVTVASLVLASGGTARGCYLAAGWMGLATVLGVLLTGVVAPLATFGLPLAAGVTLYVGASNLVPEFQHRRSWGTTLAFFAGAAVFLLAQAILSPISPVLSLLS